MKRILLVMMQPPGSSGVQGLIYNKILPYLEANGWEFHFAGPSPRLFSVINEPVECSPSRLHYTTNVSWSRRFSVFKNRHSRRSVPYVFYGACQFVCGVLERLFRHDSKAYLLAGINKVVRQAEQTWSYDLIAGKSPDFIVLEFVAELTRTINKPLVAMVNDPYGKRDSPDLFIPAEKQKQKQILDQCCGAIFMSPLTLNRYVSSDLVSRDKAYAITDSFPHNASLYHSGNSDLPAPQYCKQEFSDTPVLHFAHLGMVPEWRPIDTLLQAVEAISLPVCIDIFGYLYPDAHRIITASPRLRNQIRTHTPVSYQQSHWIAEDCTALLVVIGPRHLDNQPSKFFEYLGHRKPVFVIGPPGNPIEAIVHELGIGIYSDINDSASIEAGLHALSNDYQTIAERFDTNTSFIDAFSAENVALHWVQSLNKILTAAKSRPATP